MSQGGKCLGGKCRGVGKGLYGGGVDDPPPPRLLENKFDKFPI